LATLAVASVGVTSLATGGPVAFSNSFPVASQSLTTFKNCTLTANTSSSTAMIDTDVRQSNATTNFGTGTTMLVASGTGTANRRVYLRFDLTRCSPLIPSSATIKLATLRLFVTVLPTACRTYDIFDATATWTETAITWNTQPFGTTLNNPPTAQRTSSLNVGAATCQNQTANAYVTGWDVTVDVAAFVAGTVTNNGWMIRDDVENSATARTGTFSTKNANNVARGPQLVITYQ
jgi:hypothetical protein